MILPRLPFNIPARSGEMVQMGRINYSDSFQDGDLADSKNISARRFPYIATRHAREKKAGNVYAGVSSMTAWNKLITVKGTKVYYDGTQVTGSVTEGEKQFAIVNTKCVIWPDKKYLDLTALTLKDLAASATASGATFTTSSMTVSGQSLTSKFNVGDCVEISGCTAAPANNKSVVIQALTNTVLTVSSGAFEAATETASITISRKIPDMDFICESENRLWGCSNADRTIYASALGDPCNFYTYEGVATDSYAVAVGSEGDFTGCCRLSSAVLFWKETVLHKMLGSYPAEYSMSTFNIEGLRAGCHKSMQVINNVLFYVGLRGVFAFTGGTPSLISSNFGSKELADAVGGNDGDTYFLCAHDGSESHLYLYETTHNIWVLEDDLDVVDFARIGKDLYFLDSSGNIYLHDNGEDDPDIVWHLITKPFYETINGRKVYSKLQIRLELPEGSYITISARCDGKPWELVKKIVGKGYDVIPVRFMINRCDKFELKIEGKGPAAILGMNRIFTVGSDR